MLIPDRFEEAQKSIDQTSELLEDQLARHPSTTEPRNWQILANLKSSNLDHQAKCWNHAGEFEKQYRCIEQRIELNEKIFSVNPTENGPKLILADSLAKQIKLLLESKQTDLGQRLATHVLNFEREQLSETDQIPEMATRLTGILEKMQNVDPEFERSKEFQEAVDLSVSLYQEKADILEGQPKSNLLESIQQLKNFN